MGGGFAPAPPVTTPVSETAPHAGAVSASASTVAAPSRRTRQGQPQQRRPQAPLLVQLFKPPQRARGWVLLVINLLIALLTASFLLVVADIVKNPPTLLDALA